MASFIVVLCSQALHFISDLKCVEIPSMATFEPHLFLQHSRRYLEDEINIPFISILILHTHK